MRGKSAVSGTIGIHRVYPLVVGVVVLSIPTCVRFGVLRTCREHLCQGGPEKIILYPHPICFLTGCLCTTVAKPSAEASKHEILEARSILEL